MAPQVTLPTPHNPSSFDDDDGQPRMLSLHLIEPFQDMNELPFSLESDMDAELDAALQLLDESFDSGEQQQDVHYEPAASININCSGSVTASNDEDASATKQNSKPRRRITKKQQISRLQCTVEELTAQLESLHNKPQVIVETLLRDETKARELMWQQIATRQLQRRKRAEQDNAVLRRMVRLQVQEAKNLKRVLKRRSRIEMMEQMLGVKRLKSEETNDLANTLCVLESMLRDVDKSYVAIDQVFAREELEKLACPGKTRLTIRQVTNGVFLEIMEKQLVPFARKMTEDAVWAALGQVCMESLQSIKDFNAQISFHAQHSQKSNNTMMISYLATTSGFPNLDSVQIQKVVRKFVETDRSVFICQLVSTARHENGCSGVAVHGTLRIVVEKPQGGKHREEDTTHIKTLHSVSRYMPLPPNPQAQDNVDMAIAVWGEMLSRITARVECFLLDDSCSSQATS